MGTRSSWVNPAMKATAIPIQAPSLRSSRRSVVRSSYFAPMPFMADKSTRSSDKTWSVFAPNPAVQYDAPRDRQVTTAFALATAWQCPAPSATVGPACSARFVMICAIGLPLLQVRCLVSPTAQDDVSNSTSARVHERSVSAPPRTGRRRLPG